MSLFFTDCRLCFNLRLKKLGECSNFLGEHIFETAVAVPACVVVWKVPVGEVGEVLDTGKCFDNVIKQRQGNCWLSRCLDAAGRSVSYWGRNGGGGRYQVSPPLQGRH